MTLKGGALAALPHRRILLRHPTLALELLLPRGSLSDLLLRLGYTETQTTDVTAYLSTQEKELYDDPEIEYLSEVAGGNPAGADGADAQPRG